MRILYVEDNPANLFLVQRVARMGNHEVLNYNNGESALENFERDKPDLVLMDVQLAGEMTGLDVVRKLRGSGYKTPIIAVTAYAMVGDRERCLEAGCDDYMAKPLPVPKLVEIITKYDPQQATKDTPAPATEPERAAPPVYIPADPTQPSVATEPMKRTETSAPVTEAPKSAEGVPPAAPVADVPKPGDSLPAAETATPVDSVPLVEPPKPDETPAPATPTAESAKSEPEPPAPVVSVEAPIAAPVTEAAKPAEQPKTDSPAPQTHVP